MSHHADNRVSARLGLSMPVTVTVVTQVGQRLVQRFETAVEREHAADVEQGAYVAAQSGHGKAAMNGAQAVACIEHHTQAVAGHVVDLGKIEHDAPDIVGQCAMHLLLQFGRTAPVEPAQGAQHKDVVEHVGLNVHRVRAGDAVKRLYPGVFDMCSY